MLLYQSKFATIAQLRYDAFSHPVIQELIVGLGVKVETLNVQPQFVLGDIKSNAITLRQQNKKTADIAQKIDLQWLLAEEEKFREFPRKKR